MTDDRDSLGARIAEAMGWVPENYWNEKTMWAPPGSEMGDPIYSAEWFVSWQGYGIVDAWMREQGWDKEVVTVSDHGYVRVRYDGFRGSFIGIAEDEPLAAIQAALKALEARE